MSEWLPPIIPNKGYNDWNHYFNAIYGIFEKEFIFGMRMKIF